MLDNTFRQVSSALTSFLKLESTGGLMLMAAAALALILSNTSLEGLYEWVVYLPVEVRVGPVLLAKPLLHWVNDGLMAIFFLLVGLEVKREVLEGELSSVSQTILPATAALGGMVVPALIYYALNRADPLAVRGWAIPTATDIAFALGVLSLLGSRVPASLRLFLTAIAIADDLGAIIIIAVFYTADLTLPMLVLAGIGTLLLCLLNLFRVRTMSVYAFVGTLIWFFMLKSGVHATLAGVVLAFTIPRQNADGTSMLRDLEHKLHPWVAFFILPVFAFANAGVSFAGLSVSSLMNALPLGIFLGLLLGKSIGVYGLSAILVRFRMANLPAGANQMHLLGVAVLCGLGFTMSLFIGSLAFQTAEHLTLVRVGVIAGSTLSAVIGCALLHYASKPMMPARFETDPGTRSL